MSFEIEVNGRRVKVDPSARTTLADCLRQDVGVTGTHVGCEHGICGACTVIVNGDAVRSCLMLAVQAEGARITTIEGLGDVDNLSPLQLAFKKHPGLQCGFCTPGVLTTLHVLLTEEPDASEERIRDVLSGNICRCTGYIPIIEAAMEAREAYRAKAGSVGGRVGGGGAGGVVYVVGATLPPDTYTITVGAGGAAIPMAVPIVPGEYLQKGGWAGGDTEL